MSIVRKSKPIEKIELNVGAKTFKQVLISDKEAPNFAMRKFSIEPNGFMPLHKNTVEHEQYVLSVSAEIIIGSDKFIVTKNDVVFIPENIEHSYKCIG